MSLNNYQKIEILADMPEVQGALKLFFAAFKDMGLNQYLSIDGKEYYTIVFIKQVKKEESN